MDLNFIISFILGFIIAIIFSLERVRNKFIRISLDILLKFHERKRNKILAKALFSKNLKEKTKAIEKLTKAKSLPVQKKLLYNIIKLLLVYFVIVSIIILTIGYIIISIFNSPIGYILGWFIGFIAMIIKNRFF